LTSRDSLSRGVDVAEKAKEEEEEEERERI
jgi:hypothetical protein